MTSGTCDNQDAIGSMHRLPQCNDRIPNLMRVGQLDQVWHIFLAMFIVDAAVLQYWRLYVTHAAQLHFIPMSRDFSVTAASVIDISVAVVKVTDRTRQLS